MRAIYLVVLSLCIGSSAFAGEYFYTTTKLAKVCRAEIRAADEMDNRGKSNASDLMDGLACLNYVQGVLDAFEAASKWNWAPKGEAVCIPPDVKGDQAVRIFMKYADNHPEELNKAAPSVLWSAMHSVFPCTTN
jgi:hypothetical protein